MGWLIELLFDAIREKVSRFIIDMMDVAAEGVNFSVSMEAIKPL